MEQTRFQACLLFGEAGLQAFLSLGCLALVLAALFLAAFLAAVFLVSGLLLLLLEKLQERRHLRRG